MKRLLNKPCLIAVICSSVLSLSVAHAGTTTYTSDADFDLGILNAVNHDAPNSDQLQINETGSTFPVLWVANAGEDSVSKIDTDNDCEDARYSTWFAGGFHSAYSGPAPSRTAVDVDGNVYVANRHFDGRPASVMKILADGGIDRNGNGTIETSTDNGDCTIDRGNPAEFMPPVDDNVDGVVQNSELRDERVAWIAQVGPNGGLGRSLCIGTDGNLWVGLYNRSEYYKISSTDGSVLAGPIATASGLRPYGCLVDGDGILWSASLSTTLGVLDTNTNTWLATLFSSANTYGIALANDKVYLGRSGRDYQQYDPKAPDDGDPTTGTFSFAPTSNFQYGIATDGDGNIVGGLSTMRKVDAAGAAFWSTPNPLSLAVGVAVDSNNNVWSMGLNSHNVAKFAKDTGNILLTKPVGRHPYTYSDSTGFAARNITDPSGIWTVINDSGDTATEWDGLGWNSEPEGNIPAGASIEVEVRVANSAGDLSLQPFTPVSNGGTGLGMVGQFMEIKAVLRPNDDDESPVLSDLSVNTVDDLMCDANTDGAVNILDIQIIGTHRNTPAAPGHPLDIDGNGVINKLDARKCVLECDNARCAI